MAAAALLALLLVRGLLPAFLLKVDEVPPSPSPNAPGGGAEHAVEGTATTGDDRSAEAEDGEEASEESEADPGSSGRRRRRPQRRNDGSGADEPDEGPTLDLGGVVATGGGAYRLPRALVEEAIERGARPGGVRATPRRVDGQIEGYRLEGGAASLPALGLRPGDVLTSVNGMDLDSPDAALAIFGALRRARRVSLRLERDGSPMTLRYAIE